MHHNQIICNPSCRKHVCLCVCEGEMVNFFTPQLPSLQSLQCVQDKGFHMFVKQNLIHSNCKRKNQDSYTTNIATFSFILKLRYATIERFNKTKREGWCGRILTDHHPNTVQSDHLHQLLESQWSTEWNSDLHLLIYNKAFHQN